MTELELRCMYCDKHWTKTVYYMSSAEDAKCPRCGDSNVKVKEVEKSDVYGYNYKQRGLSDKI